MLKLYRGRLDARDADDLSLYHTAVLAMAGMACHCLIFLSFPLPF